MNNSNKRDESFIRIFESLRIIGFHATADRLNYLSDLEDFEEGEKPLSLKSAQNFQKFIKKFVFLNDPLLGIFPEGTLSASWQLSDNHILFEFFNDGKVSFAMILSGLHKSKEKFRLNGRGTREDVLQWLQDSEVTEWLHCE